MKSPNLLTLNERQQLEKAFCSLSPLVDDMEPHLKGVIQSSLSSSGSLTRAQLAYKIMLAFGESGGVKLACGIEYLHVASLIFDDLPCMDDATERRGRQCVHKGYGEAAATLGALALITRAYALIWEIINQQHWHERQAASEYLEQQIGAAGILNGQSKDIHFSFDNDSEEQVRQVAMGKTVSLIRLSLVFPAMLGGASKQTLLLLDQLSMYWGLSYQAIDDGKDVLMASADSGKTNGRDLLLSRPNMYLAAGKLKAESMIQNHLSQAEQIIQTLIGSQDKKCSRWFFLKSLQRHMEASFEDITSDALVA